MLTHVCRLMSIFFIAVILLLGCGKKQSDQDLSLHISKTLGENMGFELEVFDGRSFDDYHLNIKKVKGGAKVTLYSSGNVDLDRVYVELKFAPEFFNPDIVEFPHGLDDRSLTFGLAVHIPVVPIVVAPFEEGEIMFRGEEVIASIYFTGEPFVPPTKSISDIPSQVPGNAHYQHDPTSGTWAVYWEGHLEGDGTGDLIANGSDLFPIATHHKFTLAGGEYEEKYDYNHDLIIDGKDVFIIASNFQYRLQEYQVVEPDFPHDPIVLALNNNKLDQPNYLDSDFAYEKDNQMFYRDSIGYKEVQLQNSPPSDPSDPPESGQPRVEIIATPVSAVKTVRRAESFYLKAYNSGVPVSPRSAAGGVVNIDAYWLDPADNTGVPVTFEVYEWGDFSRKDGLSLKESSQITPDEYTYDQERIGWKYSWDWDTTRGIFTEGKWYFIRASINGAENWGVTQIDLKIDNIPDTGIDLYAWTPSRLLKNSPV